MTGIHVKVPVGRPRSPDLDEAILNTTVALIASQGPEAATISEVVRRSGIARASVYLRYRNRDALVAAALRRAIGSSPSALTGNLDKDLRSRSDQTRALFDSPEFQALLPTIVRALLRPSGQPGTLTYDAIVPNRQLVAQAYAKAGLAGFRPDADAEIAVDLVVGGLLSHLLASRSAPSPAVARRMLAIVLAGVRARPGGKPAPNAKPGGRTRTRTRNDISDLPESPTASPEP